ncbi:hypothetical protein C3489_22780 [Streptomyces sp. Ru71]|uniref:hypothetical protein n=1 Tax=Streptomyces sp. Ru71 TaxID=2080746 RepID=UPI000CDDB520|nr:hypothetical protein [Streptomyces sp. Ru71]POX50268.1 hypothetical protein C3489_22780 [Streptomyces sp. Ru71]
MIGTRVHRRLPGGRGASGLAALVAAAALALTGCQSDDTDAKAAAPRTSPVTSAAPSTTAPEPSPASSSPTPAAEPTVVTIADHTGTSVGRAVAAARASGLRYAVYLQGTGASLDGGGRTASSWGTSEKVCEQIDDPDDRNASFDVAFVIARDGRDCAGRLLHTPAPTRTTAAGGGTSGGSSGVTGGGSGTSGSSWTCAITSPAGNCYADGQFCATRHHGLSTYGKGGEYLTCEQDSDGRWRWSDGHAG